MDKKKKILTALGTVAALGCLYFAYQYVMYVTTDDAQVEAHAVLLAAKVGGYVKDVKVVEGQKVNAGDLLVELDERDYQNTLDQMQGEVTSIEAQKKDSERNFHRMTDLYDKGAISQQQFDTSRASYTGLKAKFGALTAQVSQAQLNLENTKIKAPSNGFIARKSVEVGQLAAPGVPLLGFVSAEERWVTANFKETDVENIRLGAPASISIDAISGKTFKGKVVSISSATGSTFTLLPPDNATGNFTKVVQRVPVKIEFEKLNDSDIEVLRAGLSADVKVSKH